METGKEPFDNHFLNFEHVVRFRVSQITKTSSYSGNNKTVESSDDFIVTHNAISYIFKPYLAFGSKPQQCFCLGLQLVQAPYTTLKANWTVSVLVESVKGSVSKRELASQSITFSKSANLSTMLVHTFGDSGQFTFPLSAENLSEEGYLTEDGLILAFKYELKIHRTAFDVVPNLTNAVLPLSPYQPSELDLLEFDQLKDEVMNESRFVLEASDETRFIAHKNRLVSASDYFKGLFRQSLENGQYDECKDGQLRIVDLSAIGLEQVLKFIYLRSVDKEAVEHNIVQITKAADKYLLDNLKNHCHFNLLKLAAAYDVTASEIVEYLRLAHQTNMSELKKLCMQWLHDRWQTVKGEEDVKNLMNDREGKEIIWDYMDVFGKK